MKNRNNPTPLVPLVPLAPLVPLVPLVTFLPPSVSYFRQTKHSQQTIATPRTGGEALHLYAWPNPVGTTSRLILEPSRPGTFSVQLIDPLGREISTLFEGEIGEGRLSIPFSREEISAGFYFVRAIQDGEEGSGSTIPLIVR